MTFLAYSAPHGCSCVARRDCGCELSPFPFVKDARPPSLYLRQLAPATCLATCGGGLLGGGGGDGGGVVTWWSGIALRRGVRTELVQICPRVVYQCSPTRIDTRSTQEQKASTSAAQTASRRLRGLRAHVTVIVGVPAHQLGVNSRGHLVRIVQVVVASAFGAVGVIPRGSSRQRVEHRSRSRSRIQW